MFSDSVSQQLRRVLPCIAILATYGGFVALPQRRHQKDVLSQAARHAEDVRQLEAQLAREQEELHALRTSLQELNSYVQPSTTHLVANHVRARSLAAATSELLRTLDSHNVQCTAAKNLDDEPATYQVSLIGAFPDLLGAIESLTRQLPRLVVRELSMDCSEADNVCRWTLAVHLEDSP